ncbi:fibro-slime domain-containing protein [Ruminococcus sp.]|uniref:fibro-slime domain-containing protein n=1 Tax=Ruminococcus sp. TaxID=41978 RepID=UPI00388EE6C7
MTKKQNRVRGFGKRSLSVILAMLIVLSTMVVMLTSTMLTANAAISYWNVAGNFNGWGDSLNNTAYRISGSSGSVTINISSDSYSSITFKMCAYEGSWHWCGNSTGSTSSGAETELGWDDKISGYDKDIQMLLPSGTTQVTFTITVKNGKNYVTATANGTGGGGEGSDTTQMTYDAPVNTSNPANNAENLFWANATYFDYESDKELSSNGWLNPIQAGTLGFGGSVDEWYPFFIFNRSVVKAQADAQPDWSEPLYFGNFCNTPGAYNGNTPHHQGGVSNNGYTEATNSYNATRFVHIANNSDKNSAGGDSLANMYCSYQGLVNQHLSASGDLLLPNGQIAPYFNSHSDTPLEGYAKIVNSSFPFRVNDVPGANYKKYTFNSKNATDNVYFTWATNGSTTYPTGVNYGAGTTYGVLDGVSRFMYNTSSGYGIFPFNNASSNYKGVKTNANENLNYGFGIKTQMRFRVPKPSDDVNTESDPIYFSFSGDDDLWMYITDESGNSQLVLDMGGDHKESTGKVNFHTLTSTVDKVGTSGGAVNTSFNFDYDQTYTMTVFYMERGLIESNCEMEFTMYPAGNQVNVEKEVNVANINSTSTSKALQNAVKAVDTFNFTAYQATSASGANTAMANTEYMHTTYGVRRTNTSSGLFSLKNSEKASFLSQYATNSYVTVAETNPNSGSNLSYTTRWNVTDPQDSSRNLTNQTGLQTTKLQLKNPTGDAYDYAQLDYKFVNTPNVGNVSVTKNIPGATAADRTQQFNAKVEVSLNGTSGPFVAYPLTYSASDISGRTFETNASGMLSSSALLKAGRTLTFRNLPTNAVVRVTEQLTNAQKALYQASYQGGRNAVTVPNGSTSAITVVNTPITPDSVKGFINGFKLLDNTNYTGDMFKFIEEGVARSAGDPANIIDTSGIHDETTSVDENSVFRFSDLTFDKEGIYRYHVYEDTSYLTTPDTTFDTDFTSTKTHYLVEFTVTKQSNKLVVGYPVYYAYTPTGNPITSADFDPAKEEPSLIIFNNLEKGNLRIEKENQKGEKVKDVEFAVYEVDEDMQLIIDGRQSGAQKYDSMITYINANGIQKAGSGVTGQDGVATINNLPIYKDNFVKATKVSGINHLTVNRAEFTGYKKYILLELASTGTAGYSINKTIGAPNGTINANNVFSFPINSQYDFTFSFVNNQLKNPSTAGSGMTLFKILGMGLAALSILALGGYLLYTKKAAKRKAPKHVMK